MGPLAETIGGTTLPRSLWTTDTATRPTHRSGVRAMSDSIRTCRNCGYPPPDLRERDAHVPCPDLVTDRNGLPDPEWRLAR